MSDDDARGKGKQANDHVAGEKEILGIKGA